MQTYTSFSACLQVYDLSFTVDLEPLVHIRQLDPSLNQLVNQSSITVLRLIKFAKRLDEFARLPQVCQIGILKGCWIHILLLRSVSLYDCQRDVWVTPRGDIPTEILKVSCGSEAYEISLKSWFVFMTLILISNCPKPSRPDGFALLVTAERMRNLQVCASVEATSWTLSTRATCPGLCHFDPAGNSANN